MSPIVQSAHYVRCCWDTVGHTSICRVWVTVHWGQYANFILENCCSTSERKGLLCVLLPVRFGVSVCALTRLLGRQSQLWVQVWTVVRIYPAFILLSPTANPVQTNTCKQWHKKCINTLCMTLAKRDFDFFWLLNMTTKKLTSASMQGIKKREWNYGRRGEKEWTGGRLWGLGVKVITVLFNL